MMRRAGHESFHKCDDLDLSAGAYLARPASRKLERTFVRLCTRVTKEDSGCKGTIDEFGREQLSRRCPVKIRGVNESCAQRLGDYPRNPGISIAESVHSDSAGKIEIPLAIRVYELHALAPHELHGSALVGTEERIVSGELPA